MPDIIDRDGLEAELAAIFAQHLERQQLSLLELMGDPPSMANLPATFWADAGEEMTAALRPFFTGVFLNRAEQTLAVSPIGVEWGLINEAAVTWSRDYSFRLVSGINDTSRRVLQQSIGQFFEEQMTRGELEGLLMRPFGPVRSEMIAVTEVTRAAAEGERAIALEIRRDGIDMVPIHQTNNDALVCPICGPRHQQEIVDAVFPPLHVRCRCWVTHEIRERA